MDRRCGAVWFLPALVLGLAVACKTSTSPSPTTGLTGIVLRGPVTPVCRVDVPCDAPFSAGFSVQQNSVRVAAFRSDTDGRFKVLLAPGTYRVIPDADAPIIMPTAQVKNVTVGDAVGLTEVILQFDTGIR